VSDATGQGPTAGPLVSVTRFRARLMLFLPLFMVHAQRCIGQLHWADGFIAGAVRRDSDIALWTMTVWRDEQAVKAYVNTGAHRAAMPRLADWGAEASTVRWLAATPELPDWDEATSRMRAQGNKLPLRHPGPNHGNLSYPEAQMSFATRL
jgi:quinol monooxygenase YgiN